MTIFQKVKIVYNSFKTIFIIVIKLIYSHFHIPLDDVVNVERKPLALITNNMHSNNNTLNNSNEASDGSLNYNSHLINTPRSFSPLSTNMHQSTFN